jgi:hypothetical protein
LLRKTGLLLIAALLCGLVFAAGAMAKIYDVGADGTWSSPDNSPDFKFDYRDRVRFTVTQRAKVTVKLTFAPSGSFGGIYVPSTLPYSTISDSWHTLNMFTLPSFLDPGTYYTGFYFYKNGFSYGRKVTFAVTAQPVAGLSEPVGNHSLESAHPVAMPGTTSGMVGAYGGKNDYYKLTLAKPAKVAVAITNRDSEVNLRLYRPGSATSFFSLIEDYGSWPDDIYNNQYLLEKPETQKFTISLPAGDIYIAVCDSKYGSCYNLSLKYAGSAAGVFKMPAKKTVTAGFTGSVLAQIEPSYFDQPGDVVYSVLGKDAKYAAIDPLTGQFRGLSPGKATLYARSEKLNKTIKCTLTVAKNEYTRSKPWYRSARGVYVSVKRLAYSGNNVIADLYVYNRTGRRIRVIYYLGMDLWESDEEGDPVGESELGSVEYDAWRPKGGSLSSGRYAVVRFVCKDQTKDKYNLRLGQLCVDVHGSYSKQAKTAGPAMEFVREDMPGALSAQSARPEAAYLADLPQ